jgi:hypothetical protein
MEVYTEPHMMRSFTRSDKIQFAHVILRKDALKRLLGPTKGMYVISDQGFLLREDGVVEAILDNWGAVGHNSGALFDQAFLDRLAKLSGIHAMLAKAAQQGRRAERRQDAKGREQVVVYA